MTSAYREGPPAPPPFRVVHGPFPLRLGRTLAGAGFTLVASILLMLGLQRQELSCGGEPDSWCVVSEGVFEPQPVARFPRRELSGVSIESRWGGKDNTTEYGRPVLAVGGREYRLREVDAERAREIAAEVERTRASGTALEVKLSQSPWLLVFGLAMLAGGLGVLRSALRGVGRLVIDVEPSKRRLSVQRRVLGLPGRSTAFELFDVHEVSVEQSDERDVWKSRADATRPVGRLILISSNGKRQELSRQSFPGRTVHLRAAAALRRGFGLEPGPLEKELEALERNRERPAWAANIGTFSLIWMGAPLGLLLGIAAYGGIGLAIGAFRMQDPLSPYALVLGGGLGAVAGVGLMLRLARPRPPP